MQQELEASWPHFIHTLKMKGDTIYSFTEMWRVAPPVSHLAHGEELASLWMLSQCCSKLE